MKVCSKCKQNKKESEFNFKNKLRAILHSQCKECSRKSIKSHYERNKDYYLGKANKRNGKIRSETIVFLTEYLLNNPCIDCGEKDITVLEFDHKDRSSKFKAVSTLLANRYTLDIIKKEVQKCEVRCANCHRRKTALELNWFKK